MLHQEMDRLKPFEARAIIEELRKGSVPVDYVPFFTVGRENWLTLIEDDLDNYIAQGGAKVRFLSGDYGDGKTHFMSVIRHLALKKGFAVSFVVLTREVPIHKFEAVYQAIVKQLRGRFEGLGIQSLLDEYVDAAGKDLLREDGSLELEKLTALSNEIRSLPGMDINFANGVIALLNNRLRPLEETETQEERDQEREILHLWFEGGKVAKKDIKPFHIFETVNKNNSKSFLNALISFLRFTGYQGLILLMDELETVISQGKSIRNAAYENVRLLIDNTEQAGFLHIFFSIIPDILESEKGFKSYDALWSRVRSIGESKRLNYRGVLIDLHRTPLRTRELTELGKTLRTIHGISYRWNAEGRITEQLLTDICKNQKKMGVLSEVRLFVKQVIRILDMGEQGEEAVDELDLTAQMVQSQEEMAQEKVQHLEPKWDS
ncbi:MAG: ATP-binding protein [Desulfohalobiaceae bacterium]|nr:ATP-binding protein [Desulfohalobiaceae bacterium]